MSSVTLACLTRKQEAHGSHCLNEHQCCMIEKLEIIYYLCNINLLEKKNNKQEKLSFNTEDSYDSKQILPLYKFPLIFTIFSLSPLFMKSLVLHWRKINPQNQRILCANFSPLFEQIWFCYTQGCFVPSLVEISPVVL